MISSTKEIPFTSNIPEHIAIIMDGNGRWATSKYLPRVTGHVKGIEAVKVIVKACIKRDISFLTLFAFSSENWRRPADEVKMLMNLFSKALDIEVAKLNSNEIRLKIVGELSHFDDQLQKKIFDAESLTSNNSRLTLTICANYGGRWDLLQAINKVRNLQPEKMIFTEDDIHPHLSMSYAPEPDLFIRTGGEKRMSNFLLWQLAYTELYFTETFWPDFNEKSLDLAIASYQKRERRFGQTTGQLFSIRKVS